MIFFREFFRRTHVSRFDTLITPLVNNSRWRTETGSTCGFFSSPGSSETVNSACLSDVCMTDLLSAVDRVNVSHFARVHCSSQLSHVPFHPLSV